MNYRQLSYRGKNICYSLQGEGFPVVFIHGFLLSSKILGDFGRQLAEKYKLVAIDLPGHGQSDSLAPDHSMESMAEAVATVLKREKIRKYGVIGHSMGGYVALALWEKYPENLEAVILLNSHPFADSTGRRRDRERINHLIKKGKRALFIREVLKEVFATQNSENGRLEQETLRAALRQDEESLIATSRGMMERPDRSHLLHNPGIPFCWLAGRFDKLHAYAELFQQAKQKNITRPQVIETGHISFRDDPYEIIQLISEMIPARF